MVRKNTEDILVMIVSAINTIKRNKTITNLAEICDYTELPNVVVSRYLPFFVKIGKLNIQERVSERGIERSIDVTKFDLKIV